eukprot:1180167-Prorocentrum_minimum.AAC.3
MESTVARPRSTSTRCLAGEVVREAASAETAAFAAGLTCVGAVVCARPVCQVEGTEPRGEEEVRGHAREGQGALREGQEGVRRHPRRRGGRGGRGGRSQGGGGKRRGRRDGLSSRRRRQLNSRHFKRAARCPKRTFRT